MAKKIEIDLDHTIGLSGEECLASFHELPNSGTVLDIWGYHNQVVTIDFGENSSEESECLKKLDIDDLTILCHNFLKIKFVVKNYVLKIKNLILKLAGGHFLGGAEVGTVNKELKLEGKVVIFV